MAAVVPIYLCLSLSMGASVAIAARGSLKLESLWRSSGLWSLVAFQVLVFMPVGAYLVYRQPSWSYLYLIDGNSVTPAVLASTVGAFALVSIGGFLVARQLLRKEKLLWVCLLVAFGVVLAAAIFYFGREPLSVVGTKAAYDSHTARARPFANTPVFWVMWGASAAVLFGFGATLHRLITVGRVTAPAPSDTRPEKRRPGTASIVPPAKRAKRS